MERHPVTSATRGTRRTGLRLVTRVVLVWLVVGCAASVHGCGPAEPVVVSREALGTVVSITAYGEDPAAVRAAVEDAYDVMDSVEREVDAYDAASAISAFNASPYDPVALPASAITALDAVSALGVSAEFSPSLLAVTGLYRFGEGGVVPEPADLTLALVVSRGFGCVGDGTAVFARPATLDARLEPGGSLAPGLDLGGAAKGLALDRAREALRENPAVTAALISSGSSTVTLGTKPDGSAWRIGIEDPRDASAVVATFAFEADGALSTSGDYQRYFEAGGLRYHHILDPATGLPARGLRSLTVAGSSLSGLHSDILSTALFVRGEESAGEYARTAGLALFTVNDKGRTLVVPAPENSGLAVAEEALPKP